jgi:hypothetical protein
MLKARFSADRGSHFEPAVTLTNVATGPAQAFALGNRIAVVYPEPDGIKLRSKTTGAFGPERVVAPFSSDQTFKNGYTPTVTLFGQQTIGVAWSECRRANCTGVNGTSPKGVDVAWRESTDNGATWKAKVALTNSTSTASGSNSRRISDNPLILYTSSTTRHVVYNTSSINFSTSQLQLRTGRGAP